MPTDLTPSNDAAAEWLRQVRSQKRKCAEEQGVLRSLLKRAKADGMNISAMAAAILATKQEPEAVEADLCDQIRYMGIVRVALPNINVNGLDLEVTTKTAREDDLWDAEDAGYRAGRHGVKAEDAPYAAGSELHVHWLGEWHKGQASIVRELGADVKPASPSRTRPARAADFDVVSDQPPLITLPPDVHANGNGAVKRGRGRPKSEGTRTRKASGPRKPAGNGATQPAA